MRLIYELLFPNSWLKNLGEAYTQANTVFNWYKKLQFGFKAKSTNVQAQ
jgi:hypothetical protein